MTTQNFQTFNPLDTYAGNVFWVRSGQSNSNPGTRNKPFATLDYAIGRCTANNGDQIHIKAGHTENISAASGVDFDVAGITVIGHGINQQAPTFSWTASTATLVVDAANTVLYNLNFVANFLDVAEMINVGAVAGFQMHKCKIEDTSTVLNWLKVVVLASGASDFHFVGNTVLGRAANNDSWITTEGAVDGFHVEDNVAILNVAQATLVGQLATIGAITDMNVSNNWFINQEPVTELSCMTTDGTGNDGVVVNNWVGNLDSTWAVTNLSFDVTGALQFNTTIDGGAGTTQGTVIVTNISRETAT